VSALVKATEVVKRLPFEAVVDVIQGQVIVVVKCHERGDDMPEVEIAERRSAAAAALVAAGLVARRLGTATLFVREA
jgi:hypothetical protein